jgi:hypothetical protein
LQASLPELDPNRSAWDAVLTELELAVDGAAEGDTNLESWTPPLPPAELPSDFVERAQRILERQRMAIDSLQQARASVGRHLAAVDAVPSRISHSPSAYLDVLG